MLLHMASSKRQSNDAVTSTINPPLFVYRSARKRCKCIRLRRIAFVWSFVNLGKIPSGSTANEVARIQELASDFDLQAYLLWDAKTPEDLRNRLQFWFAKPIPGVHCLPNPDIPYGLRGIFSFMLGVYVSIILIMASRRNRIDLVMTRMPIPSLPVL